ncbi:hypothetical protein OEV98_02540 [Caldibacillus lycopersici]|uniref:Uncharacterized protein n=1 Tax=Perspicuibacillus lycopersici TaxID=1325689 RepID=A0AAE3IQ01_9BACI|nr:hypothetical protein [Perspicuibacillus lycopersici]MCU9612440.1 hypothetical protein [Perspicuibacillus lycopersici]
MSEKKWAVLIFAIILLAYIIPYTLLTNVAAWYGSFLFWIVLTVGIIGINFFMTKDWGK